MKTEEDEAFEAIERRQGGFQAKRAMAADKLQEDLLNYGTSWSQDGKRIDPMSVYKEPAQERCCYHDSDCAVHNMPAYPAGPCDCTQQFKFWSVTGKYERQAFVCLSNAEAYCKGLNATYPEGNYIVSPLYTTLPQREWVGLTDEDKQKLAAAQFGWEDLCLAVEAKLKEKNT